MNQENEENAGMDWVKLHLAPQNENHMMPDSVIGVMIQETATAYVLSNMLENVETDDGWDVVPSKNMNFISRMYVWRAEMLSEPPQLDGFGEVYNGGSGGLG